MLSGSHEGRDCAYRSIEEIDEGEPDPASKE
jgi:hypothetical protein